MGLLEQVLVFKGPVDLYQRRQESEQHDIGNVRGADKATCEVCVYIRTLEYAQSRMDTGLDVGSGNITS